MFAWFQQLSMHVSVLVYLDAFLQFAVFEFPCSWNDIDFSQRNILNNNGWCWEIRNRYVSKNQNPLGASW